MCSNYEAVTRADRLLSFFGVTRARDDPPVVTFPTGLAPFVRLAEDGSGNRRVDDGAFGLLPHFAKEIAYGRRTYNARSETVAKLESFRESWAKSRRCIIPAESIFEPEYDADGQNPVRTRIYLPGEVPMAIAGIYRKWRHPKDGREIFSFAMLTVNAQGHPVFKRFHKPDDEKRMVVFLEPHEYDDWLSCPLADAPKYFRQWMVEFHTHPAPLPPRAPKAHSGQVIVPQPPDLFG